MCVAFVPSYISIRQYYRQSAMAQSGSSAAVSTGNMSAGGDTMLDIPGGAWLSAVA